MSELKEGKNNAKMEVSGEEEEEAPSLELAPVYQFERELRMERAAKQSVEALPKLERLE